MAVFQGFLPVGLRTASPFRSGPDRR